MLCHALVFLFPAVIAGAFSFGGIAGTAAGIAPILLLPLLAPLLISPVAGLFRHV